MFRSRSLLSLVALSLLLSAAPSTAMNRAPINLPTVDGTLENFKKLPSARAAAFAFMLASTYSLYSRLPVEEGKWESRFNAKELLNVSSMASSKYWKNLWYLYEDEWVGQCYKSKSIKLDKDGDHRLQVHKGDCPPQGFCGNLDARVKIMSKGMEGLSNVLVTYFMLHQFGVFGPIQQKINAAAKDMGNPIDGTNASPLANVPVVP